MGRERHQGGWENGENEEDRMAARHDDLTALVSCDGVVYLRTDVLHFHINASLMWLFRLTEFSLGQKRKRERSAEAEGLPKA